MALQTPPTKDDQDAALAKLARLVTCPACHGFNRLGMPCLVCDDTGFVDPEGRADFPGAW